MLCNSGVGPRRSMTSNLFLNPRARKRGAYDALLDFLLPRDAFEEASSQIRSWSVYQPTPLLRLDKLARKLGLQELWYKDESARFGNGSFKALGGSFAVFRHLAALIHQAPGTCLLREEDVRTGKWQETCQRVTFACATDGNHGKAVAWAARRFGAHSVVYIHEGVSDGRADAVAAAGAQVVRTAGNYDDSVAAVKADAARNGWVLIADTAGEEDHGPVQLDILAAYGLIAEEAMEQLPTGSRPSHVVLQGGVGGLAAGVHARLWQLLGRERPELVVVEPETADCLFRSAVEGRPARVGGNLETVMGCLSAAEPNYPAWRYLDVAAAGFLRMEDAWAGEAMRELAENEGVVVGESGAAGLAALLAIGEEGRARLGLTPQSTVLLVGSEGASDLHSYFAIVGRDPAHIRR